MAKACVSRHSCSVCNNVFCMTMSTLASSLCVSSLLCFVSPLPPPRPRKPLLSQLNACFALSSNPSPAAGGSRPTHRRGSFVDVHEAPPVGQQDLSRSSRARKMPVLLFDVMGTIVRDPFFEEVPAFFGLTMKEFLAIKHPTAWVEFEKGLLTEDELATKYFADGRNFDVHGLKKCVANGYAYLEGMETLLHRLNLSGYEMHAFSNYSLWYKMIEEKLKLSQYLSWTFVSCHTGRRKPDPQAYIEAAKLLELNPSDCIFIDDLPKNVEVASQLGMTGIVFQDAGMLEKDLLKLGPNV